MTRPLGRSSTPEQAGNTEFFGDKAGWLERCSRHIKESFEDSPKVRTLSLFSGCGGLDIGFNDAGFDIVECVEIERDFSQTLIKNSGRGRYLPNSTVHCVDIREYDYNGKVDFIIGGPPCQTFSAAGRRASGVSGTTDSRGTLFKEYVRLLKKLQPKGFVFENVYGILGAQGGEAWKEIQNAFHDAGYQLHYRILDSADYGVPQHRERLIIVGSKNGTYEFPKPTHGPDSSKGIAHFSAEEALKGLRSSEHRKADLGGVFGHLLKDIPPGLNYSFYTEKMGHPNPVFAWRSKFSDFLYKADNSRPVRTLKAQGGQYTGPFHWDSRPFDVNELKRLQTIPDEYELVGGKGRVIQQIGNSVPPHLARILACSIKSQLFNIDSPVQLDYLSSDDELTFRKRKRQLTNIYKGKAQEAITKLYSGDSFRRNCFRDYQIRFNFNDDLLVKESLDGEYIGVLQVNSNHVDVSVRKLTSQSAIENSIKLMPLKSWSLSIDEVNISWEGAALESYAAAWKFFEYSLKKFGIKSDLVQFGGYYQYPPSFELEWSKIANVHDDILKIKNLLESGFFRKTLHIKELINNLGIQKVEGIEFLRRIKEFGWDVRTTETNNMIPNDHFLLPYEYPSIYVKSVQYNKRF